MSSEQYFSYIHGMNQFKKITFWATTIFHFWPIYKLFTLVHVQTNYINIFIKVLHVYGRFYAQKYSCLKLQT